MLGICPISRLLPRLALFLLAATAFGQMDAPLSDTISQPTTRQTSGPKAATMGVLTITAHILGWSPSGELAPTVATETGSIILDAGSRGVTLYFGSDVMPGAPTEYRYKLADYDTEWTVTTAGFAHYRHLPPGHFQFQVQAHALNSPWTAPKAQVNVIQRPFFYQTWYFYLLLALGLVLLTGQLLSQRDQLLKGQMGIVLEERNRIASDCHDTLMAGFAAVSWQLEATSRLFNEAGLGHTPAGDSCTLARSMVSHCQAEARRIIWDLRDTEQLTDVLSKALSHAIETHRLRDAVETTFEVLGEEIPIAPGAVHHLVCIGQEAVTNAIRHAEATHIFVTLRYEDDALSLSVRDNGRGFHVSEAATSVGHFGIPVMHERARKLGGGVHLVSSSATGTEVSVTVGFQAINRGARQQHYVVPWIGL